MHKRNGRFVAIGSGVVTVAAVLAACVCGAAAQAAAPAAAPATAPTYTVPPGPLGSMKDAYAKDFLIGTAIDFPRANAYSDAQIAMIKQQYDVVTPENSMKPGNIEPAEGQWNFDEPDRLVQFCTQNNIKIIGHNLCWHSQTGNWFFTDANNPSQWADRDTIIKRFVDHIKTEVGRYKGKIKGWDVVNEAIDDGGRPTAANPENLRNDNWYQGIGPEYLTIAFKTAHEADPDADLHYNDYNIEKGAKHTESMLLLKRLISEGAPITAVGIQGHWAVASVPYADLDKAISDYQSLGLKVMISELDITMGGMGGGQLNGGGGGGFGGGAGGFGGGGRGGRGGRGGGGGGGGGGAPGAGGNGGGRGGPGANALPELPNPDLLLTQLGVPELDAQAAPGGGGGGFGGGGGGFGGGGGGFGGGGFGGGGRGGRGGGGAGPTAAQLQAQADAYAKVFAIFLKHKDAITRVTFWGINDGVSWKSGQSPLVFDAQDQAKPAFEAVLDVAKGIGPPAP